MNITDTHTHLYLPDFDADREALLARAQENGVHHFYMPNIDRHSVDIVLNTAKRYEMCYPMMGLHPCSVKNDFESELKFIEPFLTGTRCKAVGEIGIDLYWDKSHFDQQKEAFRIQCGWAVKHQLPVVIHTRNSFSETVALLKEMKEKPRGIFHCFGGSIPDAELVIGMGFMIGIGGVLTFKNSGLDKVVAAIGLEHMVLETDSPYLAPAPHRGKRNLPEYIRIVAEKVAAIKNISVDEAAAQTSLSAVKLFSSKAH